jgi:hypothetical protein
MNSNVAPLSTSDCPAIVRSEMPAESFTEVESTSSSMFWLFSVKPGTETAMLPPTCPLRDAEVLLPVSVS